MATVNADTWATELGVLTKCQPRLITTFRTVETGTSGAISMTGILASLGGAALVGVSVVGALFLESNIIARLDYTVSLWILAGVAVMSGLVGSLVDSLLGATVQSKNFCSFCKMETEKTIHSCGIPTRFLRGCKWLNNDMVNLLMRG